MTTKQPSVAACATDQPRILIVDDNRASAAITSLVLLEVGWAVNTARDGFEAIVSLQAQRYAAVLLDYRLPGMDGVDVLKWMNRNLRDRPPVIFLSSDPASVIAPLIEGLGAHAILTKPVAAADLSRAVAGILASSD